mmetsp:Transcript_38573/g.115778  ORF Transcript_38573/g.115778 Transcript_38573/m.115778 type:complete len:218 (+) Transcript_38573:150-803(+)
MSTKVPLSSSCSSSSFLSGCIPLLVLEIRLGPRDVLGGHNVAQFGHALGITGLVVVPGVNLDQRPVDDLGRQRVHDGRPGVVGVIRAHQGLLLVAQNALEDPLLAGLLEGRVHLLPGGRLFDLEDAVREGGVEEGHPDGEAVELALELGINFDDGGGGPGRGGTQVEHAGSGAAEVGFLRVGHVHEGLSLRERRRAFSVWSSSGAVQEKREQRKTGA